jgi:hypothetical protein
MRFPKVSPPRTRPELRWSCTAAAALCLVAGDAHARSANPAGSAGTATLEDPKPRVDASAALTGPWIEYATRPTSKQHACSPRAPICVHDARDGAPLAAFERAWATMTGPLAMPVPDVDPGTLHYDVFVAEGPSHTRLEARDVRSRVDRGRAFTLLDRRLQPGCALDAEAAFAIARASLWRVAPATEEATANAQARYLASLAVPCATAFDSGNQAHPEDTIEDSSAFWNRIDWAFGRQPGGIAVAAEALHPTMTPLANARWINEPDTFDVLRLTFKNALSTGSTVDDLWLDFGVARAFVGSSDDHVHIPELATIGDAGKVPLAWDIPWPDKPRRLTQRVPVMPTGATYLRVDTSKSQSKRLRAEIEWEQHALFRWAFVKVAADGHELGRVVIPEKERATEAMMTLVDLSGVDKVVLVGVNVGDPAYAFDPDDEVFEPHGYLVTVAADE